MKKYNKKNLLTSFLQMKGLEESARDYYLKIANDENIDDKEAKATFKKISEEEDGHAKIIDKILNIINNTL